MELGQLIEYYIIDIVLEESCTKYGRDAISRSFSKKSKLCLSLDQ